MFAKIIGVVGVQCQGAVGHFLTGMRDMPFPKCVYYIYIYINIELILHLNVSMYH